MVETECVYCAVRSESLNINRLNLSLEKVKTSFSFFGVCCSVTKIRYVESCIII